jgi:hypothetical protein
MHSINATSPAHRGNGGRAPKIDQLPRRIDFLDIQFQRSAQVSNEFHNRQWWKKEAARAGTDWRGIEIFRQTVLEIAIERARQATAVLDEYDGVTGTFADACRKADMEYRERQERLPTRPVRNSLAASTIAAVDYLLKQDDRQRLQHFIANHPPSEAREIIAYAKERKLCP